MENNIVIYEFNDSIVTVEQHFAGQDAITELLKQYFIGKIQNGTLDFSSQNGYNDGDKMTVASMETEVNH